MEPPDARKGEGVSYSLADKISIMFDLKGKVTDLENKANLPEEEINKCVEMVKTSIFRA